MRSLFGPVTGPVTGPIALPPTHALARGVGSNPKTILGSALVAWWTADDLASLSLSGSGVTEWRDQVAGYPAKQAGVSSLRPIYSASSFNGAPALTGDGGDDFLICDDAALLALLADGAEEGGIAALCGQAVAGTDATTRYIAAYGNGANTGRALSRVGVSNTNRGRAQVGTGAANVTATGTTIDLSSRHAMIGHFGPTETTLEVDAATAVAASAVPATSNSRLRIFAGSAASPGNYWSGPLRDLVFYLNPSAAQKAALKTWLLNRRML